MNALRAAVARAVGPPHRDGRGPQGDVIGDYRALEPQAPVLYEQVHRFSGGAPQADDITLLALDYVGPRDGVET